MPSKLGFTSNFQLWVSHFYPIVNLHQLTLDSATESDRSTLHFGFGATGHDLSYTQKMAALRPNHVWTVLIGESESISLLPGYHEVNSRAYLITERPWNAFHQSLSYEFNNLTSGPLWDRAHLVFGKAEPTSFQTINESEECLAV